MANVEMFPASRLEASHVLEFGAEHVALATGATWRRDGIGYTLRTAGAGGRRHGHALRLTTSWTGDGHPRVRS